TLGIGGEKGRIVTGDTRLSLRIERHHAGLKQIAGECLREGTCGGGEAAFDRDRLGGRSVDHLSGNAASPFSDLLSPLCGFAWEGRALGHAGKGNESERWF